MKTMNKTTLTYLLEKSCVFTAVEIEKIISTPCDKYSLGNATAACESLGIHLHRSDFQTLIDVFEREYTDSL